MINIYLRWASQKLLWSIFVAVTCDGAVEKLIFCVHFIINTGIQYVYSKRKIIANFKARICQLAHAKFILITLVNNESMYKMFKRFPIYYAN